MKIWQIPRSDRKERCNKCLEVIKRGQFKIKVASGLRFNYVCYKCYKENEPVPQVF